MSFWDRLFGRKQQPDIRQQRHYNEPQHQPHQPITDDERAVQRYRYMLQTAPPEAIEQAHAEAFAQLTPEQRRMVLEQLGQTLPAHERPQYDDPQSLARAATRAEMRQSGTLERTFGGMGSFGGGIGMGGLMAGSFLSTMAGAFVGTAIAQQFFDNDPGSYGDDFGQSMDTGDQGYMTEAGYSDAGYGDDMGGGDFGGDFGGGDF